MSLFDRPWLGPDALWGVRRDKLTQKPERSEKKLKKILGNKKAISTILAALLMVVIVVVASVMVYAWSTGLLGGLLIRPQTGNEALNLENFSFPSTTAVDLNIRNTGAAAVTIITYYIKDSANNQWAKTTGYSAGPADPNALLILTGATAIQISAPAVYTGTVGAFTTFTSGAYTVTVVTARNNQFTFTVTK